MGEVISASRRTDIPALYAGWLLRMVERGKVMVRNSYNGTLQSVSLAPDDVDMFVFWSRNYAPALRLLAQLHGRGYRFYCHLTSIGYPSIFDPATPAPEKGAITAAKLNRLYGAKTVVWRYDPVVISSITDAPWHLKRFEKNCALYEGITDQVIISFVDNYAKLKNRFYRYLAQEGVKISNPGHKVLADLAGSMTSIAKKYSIRATFCCEPEFLEYSAPASCIDSARIEAICGEPSEKYLKRPTRKGCNCVYAIDIGGYDSCTLACRYCYANRNFKKNREKRQEIVSGRRDII